MIFLVVPECIGIVGIEERLATDGAHQPHSQMYLLYVSTDGSMRG